MKNYFQNLELVQLIMRRRIHLLVVSAMAIILAFVFSGPTFITPKYKSTAIVYPVNIIPYSMETPTEQLLQIFQSTDVRSMMIRKFRLSDHYEIDTTSPAGKSRLYLLYDENVKVKKTEYESVKIDILDMDPVTASEMVSSLISFVDQKARQVQRVKIAEVVKIFEDQLRDKKKQIDSVDRQLMVLRTRFGLLDYKTQSKEITKAYLKLASNNSSVSQYRGVDTLYRHLSNKGGELITLSSLLKSLQDDYNLIKTDYDKAQSDLVKELTYTNVMAHPYPADSKSYPVRWVIVLLSLLTSLVLAVIVFLIQDRRNSANIG